MYQLIFKNDDFIVIDKNPGVDFHSKENQIGLAAQLKIDLPNYNPLPVHRLDKPTSGLIIFANGSKNAALFSELFKYNKVNKYYLAISDCKPKKKQGAIIGDMERTRRGDWKLLRSKKNPAITRFYSKGIGKTGKRLFLMKLYTGKTHQLRVALKSIGSPILGDPRYYNQSLKKSEADRMYLVAFSMNFKFKGEDFNFQITPHRGKLFQKKIFQNSFIDYENPNELKWP